MALTPQALRARLRALPKVELHRHLEASARLETLWELHQAAGAGVHASLDEMRAALVIPDGLAPGYMGFLSRFLKLRFSYGDAAAVTRLVREVVADAAADGVVHLEIRFAPTFWARCMKTLDCGTPGPTNLLNAPAPIPSVDEAARAAEIILRAARSEAQRRGISVSFILSISRHAGVEVNRPGTELLTRPVGTAFAGVDVAGDESFPLAEVAELFEPWQQAGKVLTLHAGEDPRAAAGGARNVREAVERYGAARIGHGIRAIEEASVVELLRRRGSVLEVCPTSNVQTQSAPSFTAHPLKRLVEAGVALTLNTDDPLLCGVDLTEEYARAHERCGLSLEQLRDVALQGAKAALLPAAARCELIQRVTAAWDEFS